MLLKARSARQLHEAHLGHSVQTRGEAPSSKRMSFDQLVRRYSLWVHRCVMLNAQAAASVPFSLYTDPGRSDMVQKVFQRPSVRQRRFLRGESNLQPAGARTKGFVRNRSDDLRLVETHPLLDLMQDINPWEDGFRFRLSLYADRQIFGSAFILKVKDSSGNVTQLWRMMPQKIRVIPDSRDFVSHYEAGWQGGNPVTYEPDEVIWIRTYDPYSPWGAMGWVEAWLTAVDAAQHIQEFQRWLFERHGVPDYVVKTKHDVKEDKKRIFREEWRRLFGRFWKRIESVAFLGGEAEIERLGSTNRELEFGESEDRKRDQISAASGVPKSFNTMDDANRSNMVEARQQWFETTVFPMVGAFEDAINEQLVQKDYAPQLMLVHENPIPEDKENLRAERDSRLRSGYSVNDIRIAEEEEPLDDPAADVPLIQAGLVPLPSYGVPEGGNDAVVANPGLALDGAQITAVTDIAGQVARGELPHDTAVGLLTVLLGVPSETADRMLGSVESFEPEPPQMPALPPGGDIQDAEVVEDEEPSEAEEKALHVEQKALFVDGPRQAGDETVRGQKTFETQLDRLLKEWLREIVERLESEPEQKAIRPGGPSSPEDYIPADSFTRWEQELRVQSTPHIRNALARSARKAIRELGVTITFDPTNTRVAEYIADVGLRVGRELTDSFRKTIRAALERGIQDGDSAREIAKRIRRDVAGTQTRAWAERIARTEMAFAAERGTEEGWSQSGQVIGKRFVLSPEPCEFCRAVNARLEKKILPLGESMLPFGTVIKAGDRTMTLDYAPDGQNLQVPPVHPNCRCSTEAVLVGES